MIDIETLSTKSYAAIISIAAVPFCLKTGAIGTPLGLHITLESNEALGLRYDASTIYWWLGQPKDVQDAYLAQDKVSINLALQSLSAMVNKDTVVWGNGPRFDMGILHNAYERAGLPVPWHYTSERCVRTILSLSPQGAMEFNGTKHRAVDDALHQIHSCIAAYKSITNHLNI